MIKLKSKKITLSNKFLRVLWNVTWLLFFRTSPVIFHHWRIFLLKIFGAKLGKYNRVYPSVKIWAPWNLEMGRYSTLARNVDCYSVDKIIIGSFVTISQYSYLCSASHDYLDKNIYNKSNMKLISGPIIIKDRSWIAADVFIGPNLVIGEGVVVLARSTVIKDVPNWFVVGGYPAKEIKKRLLV